MYTKFRYETRYYYSDNDTDLDTSPKWYNPVLTPYNPIMWSYIMSFIQASSHIFVPQMPPFITGVTHWESVSFFLFRLVIYTHIKQECMSMHVLRCTQMQNVYVSDVYVSYMGLCHFKLHVSL